MGAIEELGLPLVSSHTPLRGYSQVATDSLLNVLVSSHTPLRGYSSVALSVSKSTVFQVIPPCGGILFQFLLYKNRLVCFKSYPLAGVFSITTSSMACVKSVSSHTPLRGYSWVGDYSDKNGEFQVIPPCGGIQNRIRKTIIIVMFQVIPPCGGIRVQLRFRCQNLPCFKSYPLAGVFDTPAFAWPRPLWFQVIPPCGGIPAKSRVVRS